jgi:hypothetical protein
MGGEIDIAAELFFTISMTVFCAGSIFCLVCVIDAGAYSENDDWT